MYSEFTWDEKKEAANWKKHKVRFTEAVSVFFDPRFTEGIDDSQGDERWVAMGMSIKNRLLVVVYKEVDEQMARIVSARSATPNERRFYEEGI